MKLSELQHQFSDALLYKNDLISGQIKEKDSFSGRDLLQVYRNSFVMGVTEALAVTYQHTLSLVGEEFFNAAARQFILQQPPQENNIMTYGDGFCDFLKSLEQLKEMPYIAETARFEWLLEQTANTHIQTTVLDVDKLGKVQPEQLAEIIFHISQQVTLFHSDQDIQHLYQMLINEQVQEADLNRSCCMALKKQPDFSVELIALTAQEYSLAEQIKHSRPLGQIQPQELHQFLPALMEKHLINGFTLN
ncbi:DNA-binding domain-containing protein [Psychromonas ossibalaenae]|uniref:HvfC/BufC N-terminal domain-containing protein n=1 Tax=Psychromonas ossibalaenae TaxID=444922 RepID=UPI00037CE3F5|nr:DNA-binding domain-containing protein [Psychromonas ossibalaenae]